MTRSDGYQGRTCPLRKCAVEIRRLVDEECRYDPSRLIPGTQLMAYVASTNTTETWEVVEAGSTFAAVQMRLIDLVPETSAA